MGADIEVREDPEDLTSSAHAFERQRRQAMGERPQAHRALERSALRGPREGRTWTVCRFVDGLDHGWPLRELSKPAVLPGLRTESLGWRGSYPVALFTEEDAKEVAERAKYPISSDAPVPLEAIRWRVRLFSHYDGSEVVHETDDYREALLAFAAAKDAADQENTPHVAYLVPEMDGRVPWSLLGLSEGARAPRLDRGEPKLTEDFEGDHT